MKKVLIPGLILMAAVLLIWGCSQDQSPTSTRPDEPIASAKTGPMDVLIGFKGEHPGPAIRAAGGAVKHEYKHFPLVFASVPARALKGLQQNPNVLFVEENMLRFATAQVLDWGVDRIDAEYVHANSGYNGNSIDVAILDSGGDQDHPDLTWAGGHSVVAKNPDSWDDKNGHGTHVAGIISADDNGIGIVGVAPGCDIWAVQIGRSGSFWLSDIVAGIDWCIATLHDSDPNNDIKVMSMSYGGGYAESEETALQSAYDEGILLVAAAGNNYGGEVDYPAALNCVMAISASNSSDGLAGFSSKGPEVELIAPGDNILSTYKGGGYAYMSGTSMSTPMVSGAAALAWSAHPRYGNVQIGNLLKNSAEDIGLSSSEQGSGLLDAEKATLGTTNGDNLGGGGGGADTMHVASIDFSNNKKNLYTYVTIHDEAHVNTVSRAYVTMTLHHVGGNDYNFGGNTNKDGVVKFTLRGTSSGLCFETTVTGISKDGWTYNAGSNHETTDSYCIP